MLRNVGLNEDGGTLRINAGREIMGPMAAIIIGGLVSSTLLNLLVLPSVMLRYGRFAATPAAAR